MLQLLRCCHPSPYMRRHGADVLHGPVPRLQAASGDDDEEEEKVLTMGGCFFWLTVVTLLISLLSDYVMATIKTAAKQLNVSAAEMQRAQ